MTFIKPQRQAAPWSDHNWWGQYDEAANLPNTATSTIQVSSEELQRGDMAWAEAEASLYYCDDPTAGAAIWLPLGGGGGGVTLAANYYLSADNGNDANDGLTPATAVATLDRMLSILNEAEYTQQGTPVVVHVGRNSGGPYEWNRTIQVQLYDDLIFYGDGAGQVGEDGFNEIIPSTAATGGSRRNLTLGAGPIVADNDYIGLTVEILTGAAAGNRRTIRNHTTTEIIPVRPFTDVISAGDTWRIVSPEIVFETAVDADKPLQAAQMHKQTAPAVPAPSGVGEIIDRENTGHLVLANLQLQTDGALFFPFQYSGSLKLYGCLSANSSRILTLVVNKLYCGCDTSNGIFTYFGAAPATPFDDLTGAALTPQRAGLAVGIADWSGWGMSMGRFLADSFLGYLHYTYEFAWSGRLSQLLGGSHSTVFQWDSPGRLVLGTRFSSTLTSARVIPFLFNALNGPEDFGLRVSAGNCYMGDVAFTTSTRFGVVVGRRDTGSDGGALATLKWPGNKSQVLAASVAFMYFFSGAQVVIDEAVLSAGANNIDFSGIAGQHLVGGMADGGVFFEVEAQDVQQLQVDDRLHAEDGSTAYVISNNPIP